MDIRDLEAIDVHAHFGRAVSEAPDTADSGSEFIDDISSGDAATVLRRAGLANTLVTVVSPLTALMPRLHNDTMGPIHRSTSRQCSGRESIAPKSAMPTIN